MIHIEVAKGYDPNIAGAPSRKLVILTPPTHVAVLPDRIPFVKPRLKVRKGERVAIGSVVFEDKRNPSLKFLSPGSGIIERIGIGLRRVIQEVVIKLDAEETHAHFDTVDPAALDALERVDLIDSLLSGGLWPFIKAFPFRDIADPDTVPTDLFISLGAKEPFQPDPEVYLKDNMDLFEFGVAILKKLTDNLIVCTPRGSALIRDGLADIVTHTVSGAYPVDDPGVHLYYIKKTPSQNRSWYINGQDVLNVARFFKYGRYPVDRILTLAGTNAFQRTHVKTRIGVPVRHVIGEHAGRVGGTRFIIGGLFRGYTGSASTHMGLYETSLALIPEGDRPEAFGFARPGYRKPSRSRTFLSRFNRSTLTYDCHMHGELRACINCTFCSDVCPVDILPHFTLKSITADEVEESLAHGLLDCVECGLCTYVCPSKIELCALFKKAKQAYHKELIQ